jgi:hypothetical protein
MTERTSEAFDAPAALGHVLHKVTNDPKKFLLAFRQSPMHAVLAKFQLNDF